MPTLPQLLQAILEKKIILYGWTTNWHLPRALRRQWQPTPVLLPGKFHGRRSLVGCSPWGPYELDTTECLHFHFSLSCIGEGNGNPLQCSCLKNPRDGGAWVPGAACGLPSMESHRVGHDWSDLAAAAARALSWTAKSFAIFLYRGWTPCCRSCWPSAPPEGVQGGLRRSVLQGIWLEGL